MTSSEAHPPSRLQAVALSMVQFVGLAGFVVAEIVQLVQHGATGLHDATLVNGLVWLIGVNGIVAGSGHLFLGGPVAEAIGWPRGTPWQWEVGAAGVAYGVLGVMCPAFDRDFWLATIVASSIFLFGAAAGHVRQILQEANMSPGNAGAILYTDVLWPVVVIVLYLTR